MVISTGSCSVVCGAGRQYLISTHVPGYLTFSDAGRRCAAKLDAAMSNDKFDEGDVAICTIDAKVE